MRDQAGGRGSSRSRRAQWPDRRARETTWCGDRVGAVLRACPGRGRCPTRTQLPRWCGRQWRGSSQCAPRRPWPAARWRRRRPRRAAPIQSSSWVNPTRAGYRGEQAMLECMETGRASKTALRVAIRRAAHQLADPPPVLDDPIGLRLVGSGYTRDLDRAMEKVARDFRAFVAARSRYVEDRLAEAVSRGVDQYVVLGAGL